MSFNPNGLPSGPPQQPGFNQGGYAPGAYLNPGWGGVHQPRQPTNRMAVSSVVAAVLSLFASLFLLFFTFIFGFLPMSLSVGGIVAGIVGLRQIRSTHEEGRGLAWLGIVSNSLVLLFQLVLLVIGIVLVGFLTVLFTELPCEEGDVECTTATPVTVTAEP